MSNRVAILAALAALAGCGTTEVVRVSEPVVVPGPPQYVPVPVELTADCPGRPADLGAKVRNGALLQAAKAWEVWAECVDGRLAEIRGLSGLTPTPPAAAPN